MKSRIKKISIAIILILFIAIQFFDVMPNYVAETSKNAIEKHYSVPQNVQQILKTSCYDCHSNNTVYPWYSKVQPVKWWLANHINDGKRHLNFDKFGTYPKDKKLQKLDEVAETVNADEMPLSSYTVIHTQAKLSAEQKSLIQSWVKSMKGQINKEILVR
ncbi:Haem-binding domain-containing protein [Soonwooa buanensis]|uniref:Haem-binding domain-containing protein n=1 Tax=Soonwooa buanensis TaxID=619805 RepID=A0A1T5CXV1_9FLAO|nr:heme-binding domain-containing protein [Soonwooa buanensis]SKB64166.1 Haem-binding domain-containing protein [Soonwooa buanensis]